MYQDFESESLIQNLHILVMKMTKMNNYEEHRERKKFTF
jgi:hypothetical protein